MHKLFFHKIGFILFFILPHAISAQNPEQVWDEFRTLLKQGQLTEENIKPVHELLNGRWLPFLENRKNNAAWEEWEEPEETFVVENQIHYLVKMTENGQEENYCLSFIIEDGEWYFHHAESIWVRLDNIGELPASEFPDLPESQKSWQREEPRISKMIYLFNYFKEKEGEEFALNWCKDGYGYFLWAKTHVPFLKPTKAFILALCYEQANLRGSKVTLEKLEDDLAIVHLEPIFLKLYYTSGQIKNQISYSDYLSIYETIWQDRAEKAGWKLDISVEADKAMFRFVIK
jgi:hypothetical protein